MPTILVVDDDRLTRQMLENCLRNAGHAVLVACNGHEALTIASEYSVEVILMDMNMPEVDGWTAARLIKDQIDDQMPIIAVTAYGLPADQARAMAAGCARFLTKPIKVSVLMQTIGEALKDRSEDTSKT